MVGACGNGPTGPNPVHPCFKKQLVQESCGCKKPKAGAWSCRWLVRNMVCRSKQAPLLQAFCRRLPSLCELVCEWIVQQNSPCTTLFIAPVKWLATWMTWNKRFGRRLSRSDKDCDLCVQMQILSSGFWGDKGPRVRGKGEAKVMAIARMTKPTASFPLDLSRICMRLVGLNTNKSLVGPQAHGLEIASQSP